MKSAEMFTLVDDLEQQIKASIPTTSRECVTCMDDRRNSGAAVEQVWCAQRSASTIISVVLLSGYDI